MKDGVLESRFVNRQSSIVNRECRPVFVAVFSLSSDVRRELEEFANLRRRS